MGTVVGYLLAAWRDQTDAPTCRVVDPRGAGSVFWSPFHMIKALAVLLKSVWFDGCNLVHLHITNRASTFRKGMVFYVASWLGVRTIVHLHAGRYPEFFSGLHPWVQVMVRHIFQRATCVIVLGETWKDYVAETLGVDPARVEVLYNAVPAPAKPSRGSPDKDVRIVFLGYLDANKGVSELVGALASDALKALPWKAVLAGAGDVATFRQMAETLNISDRVDFPGWMGTEEKKALLQEADVLVLPSYREGLPMVVLEGMAYGLAVVATPVGAVPEVIDDGRTGLLTPVGDVAALSAALARVVGDGDLRHSFGQAARADFSVRFEAQAYARKVTALYRRLLETPT